MEAAVEKVVSDAPTDDGFRLHAHVFGVKVKKSPSPQFRKQLLTKFQPGADKKKLKAILESYSTEISQSREILMGLLETPLVSDVDEQITVALKGYLGLLSGLALADPLPDGNSSSSKFPAMLNTSKLQNTIDFAWEDVLMNTQMVSSKDLVLELASVIFATMGWSFRRAAYLCKDSRQGITTETAAKAYKLLLQAAGGFKFIKDCCSPLLVATSASADCSIQAASTMQDVALADAQSITTLRAMAKGNAPALIAALSHDTARFYEAAAKAAAGAPFAVSAPKVQQYARYKAASFRAYALCFTGLVRLQETKAGAGVRLLEEAKLLLKEAKPLAAAYNKAEPSTPAADHTEFDRDLEICVNKAHERIQRENDHVYYQRPPRELPGLVEPRSLVTATPFVLPSPPFAAQELATAAVFGAANTPPASQAEVQLEHKEVGHPPVAPPAPPPAALPPPEAAKPEGKAGEEGEEPVACWRWLLVVIAMPLLVILSVVGAVVWIVLLPLKIFCCPIGCLIQLMADIVENVLKLPVKGLLWASGKPYKSKKKKKDEES